MATPKKESTLHHAMVRVMQEVKGIEKGLTVGSGSYSYKGVSDKDVKQQIGQAMAKNGLTCVPVKIEPTTDINRWEVEETSYGKTVLKQKMSVFVEVLSTFRITHAETKEFIEIQGFGQGQDTSDKAAGKATTYALKNALLYSFLVPTGDIDDTDKTHSNDMEQAPAPQKKQAAPAPKVEMTDEIWRTTLPILVSGAYTIAQAEGKYIISDFYKDALKDAQEALIEKLDKEVLAQGADNLTAKSQKVVDEPKKAEVVPEEKPEKKEPAKKKPAAKKAPAKKEPVKKEPIEEAEVIADDSENAGLTGFDKVAAKIDEYTSSDQLIKDKKIIELEIKLEQLTDEETAEIKEAVNDKYSRLKDANL